MGIFFSDLLFLGVQQLWTVSEQRKSSIFVGRAYELCWCCSSDWCVLYFSCLSVLKMEKRTDHRDVVGKLGKCNGFWRNRNQRVEQFILHVVYSPSQFYLMWTTYEQKNCDTFFFNCLILFFKCYIAVLMEK